MLACNSGHWIDPAKTDACTHVACSCAAVTFHKSVLRNLFYIVGLETDGKQRIPTKLAEVHSCH